MNTMKWLIKREFWEHWRELFLFPIFVSCALALGGAVYLASMQITVEGNQVVALNKSSFFGKQTSSRSEWKLDAPIVAKVEAEMNYRETDAMPPETVAIVGSTDYLVPIFFVYSFLIFQYCVHGLYAERKDRSVLFWKSLPVSDSATVVSKVLVALIIAPALAFIIGSLFTLIGDLMFDVWQASAVPGSLDRLSLRFVRTLTDSRHLLNQLKFAGILPVYALWALPTVGFLLMISAWSRVNPILWAVGVPVATGTLASIPSTSIMGSDWTLHSIWHDMVGRLLFSVLPGSWFEFNPLKNQPSWFKLRLNVNISLDQTLQQLTTPNLWIGVAAGSVMIYAAIRIRRWKDEG